MRSAKVVVGVGIAGFLALIMIIVLLFGGAGVGDSGGGGQGSLGRETALLKRDAVPDWAYEPLIRAARTCPEITAPLLAAQLEAESGWNPNAHNDSSQADGLAQFIPSTWARWGQDGDADGHADPRNPADAIASQAAYMCHLVSIVKQEPDLTGDVIELALAAYNAGPGNVLKYKGIPPFLETTSYVTKIRGLVNTKYTQPTPGGSGGPAALAAVIAARRWIGTPYAWGGGTVNGPSGGQAPDVGVVGFDCSGLVRYAYYQATAGQLTLPRTSQAQYNATKSNPVAVEQLRPGDLMFWGGPTSVHHVAIYSGDGKMIEAPQSGQNIHETAIRTSGDYLGATRAPIANTV